MKNRLAASFASAILSVGLLTPAVFAANFPDVQGTNYQGSVKLLKALSIVNGDVNGNYNPQGMITRAEFAKIAVEAAGLHAAANSVGINAITGFYDVPVGHWAAGYVKTAKAHGLIQGYGDGTFGADDYVTYEDVLTVLERLLGFTDVTVGGYSQGYISKGAALGLLSNVSFQQGLPATRGDVANLTANVLIQQIPGTGSTLLQQSFPTISNVSGGISYVTGNNVTINGTVHNLTADSDVGADSINGLIGHKVTAFTDAGNNLLYVGDAAVLPLPIRISFLDSDAGLLAGTGNSFTLSALVFDADNHPIPGITVNFSSSSSSVAAVNASAVTNAGGIAQCAVTAGSSAGAGTITASTGWLSVSRQVSVGSTIHQVVVSDTNGVAVGARAALTAIAQDASGVTIPLAPGVVPVWNVLNGGGGAVIDTNGNFVAFSPGTYQVTATINGVVSAQTNIPVYGQATGVTLSVNNALPLVENNKSTDSVTVQVVDANGNLVTGFNGSVDVSISANGGALLVGPNTTSYKTGVATLSAAAKSAVKISNGQGTFQIVAGSSPNQWVAIAAGNVMPAGTNSAIPTASTAVSVTTAAQVATSIRVNAPAFIGVNSGTEQATVSTLILDQTGNPMLTGLYPVTLSLSGASASFYVNNIANFNPQFLIIADSASGNFLLQSVKGATGPLTLTAVGNNLPTGTAIINGVLLGQASQIAVNGAKNTVIQGTPATLTAVIDDAAGNPATYALPGNLQVKLTNLDGTPATTISASAIGVNGQFTVAAVSGAAAAGTYNVQVTDASGALASSPSFPLTIASGPAAGIALSTASSYLPAAFPAAAVTAQLIDAYGNPVPKAGQSISFSVNRSATASAALNGITQDGTAATAVFVNTNAAGVAAVNFSAQSLSMAYQVNASSVGLTPAAPLTESVQQSVTNQLALRLIDSQVGSPNYNSASAAAGDALTIQVLQRDAKGGPVSPGENDSVSVTISPASGLLNLPSS
ncbi:MAG: hypothetical protein JWN30_646, partial [Bacilli bacterium]|nr:hypothetical protein [Bacilli bacterium]